MEDVVSLDLESSDIWAAGVVGRCEDCLVARASEAFGSCDRGTAHLWIGILEDALLAAWESSLPAAS
jgi:hypothetical protein